MKAMNTKVCFKCGRRKRLSFYYFHPGMKDGRLNKCKECAREDVINHRESNLPKIKAYDRARSKLPHRVAARAKYRQTAGGKEAGTKSNKKWRLNNPVSRAAHVILGNAIRKGAIVKPTECSNCGASGRVYGHHEDYSLPLDVIWVCSSCHGEIHKRRMPK